MAEQKEFNIPSEQEGSQQQLLKSGRDTKRKATNMSLEEMVEMVRILLRKDYDCKLQVYNNTNQRKDAIMGKILKVLWKKFGVKRTKDQLRKRWSDLKLREADQFKRIRKILKKRERKNIDEDKSDKHESVCEDLAKNVMYDPVEVSEEVILNLMPVEEDVVNNTSCGNPESPALNSYTTQKLTAELMACNVQIEDMRETLNTMHCRINTVLDTLCKLI
ncbi:unnamed protein product [Staurois parvus]|uniref:Regulatory protein zeste n=1 Tax=Staurois parvus TaxID=386267 RepID=A0ABN9B0D8_9NEOB|nr:unnamed protein product [Staurois parvus]